jgi:hypothetical protein
MTAMELEQQVTKVAMAMMTRNKFIAGDIIANLKSQMALEEVAGIVLISLERLLWFETELVWCIENLIPLDVRQEIKRIISFATYKHFIDKGLIPGKDFSIDASGKLLRNGIL